MGNAIRRGAGGVSPLLVRRDYISEIISPRRRRSLPTVGASAGTALIIYSSPQRRRRRPLLPIGMAALWACSGLTAT